MKRNRETSVNILQHQSLGKGQENCSEDIMAVSGETKHSRKPRHMNLCLVNQTQEVKGPSIMKENMDDILKEDEEKQGNVS